MSRNTRTYYNQKGKRQPADDRKKTSTVASEKAASGNIRYDELFPPLSASSTVSITDNPPSSNQVNICHFFLD